MSGDNSGKRACCTFEDAGSLNEIPVISFHFQVWNLICQGTDITQT